MKEKNKDGFRSPDITKQKAVIINERTTIYVNLDTDAKEAKEHYLAKMQEKEKKYK